MLIFYHFGNFTITCGCLIGIVIQIHIRFTTYDILYFTLVFVIISHPFFKLQYMCLTNFDQFQLNLQTDRQMQNQFLERIQRDSKQGVRDNFDKIMRNNRVWAHQKIRQDVAYFQRLVDIQTPEYLWIGCADSRVPANEIVGLQPGELFVHRNVANQAPPSDINYLAVLQYSVQVLKVKDIIVTGHYGCGGIKAAFTKHDHGPLQAWLSYIRDLRQRNKKELVSPNPEQNYKRLTQLNVIQQVINVARVPVVQQAWKEGQQVRIHGLVYNLHDGLLKDLGTTISKVTDLSEEFRIIV